MFHGTSTQDGLICAILPGENRLRVVKKWPTKRNMHNTITTERLQDANSYISEGEKFHEHLGLYIGAVYGV